VVITVLFTTAMHTVAALRVSARLSAGLHASIRLLATEVVPFPLPASEPPIDKEWMTNRLRRLAEASGVNPEVQLLLCRNEREALLRGIPEDHLVLIGAATRFPWSHERQLARWLQKRRRNTLVVVL
jgi:hypothetical protein